jgi:hypothetical protein
MHRYPLGEADGFEKWDDARKAEWAAYRDTASGQLFVPGENLQRCLVSAATYSKGKGRGNLSRIVAGNLAVTPAVLDLGVKDYAVDIRIVKIPATKGRVPRVRPRLDTWGLTFTVEWDETLMNEKQVRGIVDDAGKRVGLLDYRPETKGPFGRFMVTEWK